MLPSQTESSLLDSNTEKEKIFYETLQKIVDARLKLYRQQSDFDQLSLDLQTRLDDKEFKACEINESFKLFKREILERAQNSRTGQVYSIFIFLFIFLSFYIHMLFLFFYLISLSIFIFNRVFLLSFYFF